MGLPFGLGPILPFCWIAFFLYTSVNGAPALESIGESRSGVFSTFKGQKIPEMELELENLKAKNGSHGGESHHDGTSGTVLAGNHTHTTSSVVKTELNLEKPSPADNSAPESYWDSLTEKRGGDPMMSYSFTPHDIAEYIFWTGDDKGVTFAIEELIQNEVISKENAIEFLELVEIELQNLRNRYDQHGSKRTSASAVRHPESSKISLASSHSATSPKFSEIHSPSNGLKLDKGQMTEKSGDYWNDYGETIPKVEVIDKIKEFNLEKGLQQLARDLFSKNSDENPHIAMQRLAQFVEKLIKP